MAATVDLSVTSNGQQYSNTLKFAFAFPEPCYTCQTPGLPACKKNGTRWIGQACVDKAAAAHSTPGRALILLCSAMAAMILWQPW